MESTASSGDYQIDSLLSGSKWNTTTITYSFFSGGSYYGSETGVSPLSEPVKNNVRNIIENYIEPFINVNFVEVADSVSSYGQLRYMFSNGPDYAYASYPSSSPIGGDVHLNPTSDNNSTTSGFQGGPGTYGFMALIHETLHALGLKHPGNYNGSGGGPGPYLPFGEDNTTNTVMTYNSLGNSAATFMPNDLKALQHLYGAKSYNALNTTYSFNSVYGYSDGSRYWGSATTPMKLTIWDSGGTDTLNFSSLAFNASGYRFDLKEGGILTSQSAYNGTSYQARSDTSGTTYYTSTFGTAIAYGAMIENAIGSSSNDTIIGNSSNNYLSGNSGNDLLYGNVGDDYLDGGIGNDYLDGGTGNDSYAVDSTGDVIVESLNQGSDTVNSSANYTLGANLENLTLTGTAYSGYGNTLNNVISGNSSNNYLWGSDGNDSLYGNVGDDYLDGGIGNDTLAGGTGNDSYAVDSAGDVIVESLNEGSDMIYSSLNYTLGANLENLTLTGTAYSGYGNTLNNVISGNSSNNYLWGSDGNDSLYGNAGYDYLDGGNGNDTLTGGADNDSYVVNSIGDVIVESLNQGADMVYSSLNYTLGANLENLTLTGTAYSGYGNTLNNVISGNSSNNYLWGSDGTDWLNGNAGNDSLVGGNGNDYLDGGIGNDSLSGGTGNDSYTIDSTGDVIVESLNQGGDTVNSSVNYTLGANLENLTLTGTAYSGYGNTLNNVISGNSSNNYLSGNNGNDSLYGNAGNDSLVGGNGNDYLDGGNGNDSLSGGTGNDSYTIDSTGDVIVESLNQGTDMVYSSVNYTLRANLENLTLTGTAYSGYGNTLNNAISGNSSNNYLYAGNGNDTLNGGSGNDTLVGDLGNDRLTGGEGADTLWGGQGADQFIFNFLSEGIDIVKDFLWTEGDRIQISKAGLGASSLSEFSYNSLTGALLFDPSGLTGLTQFATIENKPAGFSVSNHIVMV